MHLPPSVPRKQDGESRCPLRLSSSSLRSRNLFTSSLRGLLAPFTGTGKQVPILSPFERPDKTSRITIFSTGIDQPRFINIFYSLYPAPRFLYRSSHRRILHGRILRSRNESLFPFSSLLSCSLKKCSKIFFNRTTRRAEDDSIDGDCSNFERV